MSMRDRRIRPSPGVPAGTGAARRYLMVVIDRAGDDGLRCRHGHVARPCAGRRSARGVRILDRSAERQAHRRPGGGEPGSPRAHRPAHRRAGPAHRRSARRRRQAARPAAGHRSAGGGGQCARTSPEVAERSGRRPRRAARRHRVGRNAHVRPPRPADAASCAAPGRRRRSRPSKLAGFPATLDSQIARMCLHRGSSSVMRHTRRLRNQCRKAATSINAATTFRRQTSGSMF